MIRTLATALSAFLVAAAATAGAQPATAAPAFVGCVSSIDPVCDPQALPILLDLGVINTGGGTAGAAATATAPAVASGSTGSLWGTLTSAGGGTGFGSLVTVLGAGSGLAGGQLAKGLLSTDGVHGVKVQTSSSGTAWHSDGVTGGKICGTVNPDRCTQLAGEVNVPPWTVSGLGGASNFHAVCMDSTPSAQQAGIHTESGNWAYADLQDFDSSVCPSAFGSPSLGKWLTALYQPVEDGGWGGVQTYTADYLVDGAGGPSAAAHASPAGPQAGTMTTTVTCHDPSGTNPDHDVVVTGLGELSPGSLADIPDAACPAGEVALSAGVVWTPSGGSPVTVVPKETNQVAPGVSAAPDLYPSCYGPSAVPCYLTLTKIAGGTRTSCGSQGQLCPDWASDPSATDDYECAYGPTILTLDGCSAYRRPTIGLLPSVAPDGTPIPYTAPAPSDLQTATDPTGQPLGSDPSKIQDDSRNCAPSSILDALNPFWVFKAMQCAIADAFVPRESVIEDDANNVKSAWEDTSIGKYAVVLAPLASIPAPTGCSGIPVDITETWPTDWSVHWVFGAACDDPMRTVAAVVSTIIGAGVAIFGIYRLTSFIGGAIGFKGFRSEE